MPQTGAPTTARRRTWVDLLRGTAVLMVMVNHAIGMAHIDGRQIPQLMMDATRSIEPFRLPLLLLISGLFLPRALTKPVGTFISGKLRHLLWPLVLWAPITVFTHIPDRAGEPMAWLGTSHLWYLLTLLFCYAVGLATAKLPVWVVPVAFLTLLFTVAPQHVNYLWFGAFFFIGATIVPYVRRIQDAHWGVFTGLAAVAAVGSYLHLAKVTSGQNLLVLAFALAGCGAMLWLAPRVPRIRPVRMLEAIGRRSVVFYVAHLPVIAVTYTVLERTQVDDTSAIVIAAALAFLVPLALTRTSWHRALFSFPGLHRPAKPSRQSERAPKVTVASRPTVSAEQS